MLSEIWQDSFRDIVLKSRTTENIRAFHNKVIQDIKNELKHTDKNVKTHALMKVLYLYQAGYDVKWAAMNTFEVISTCGNFGKRIGYMIGQFQFKDNLDYIQLIPSMVTKEIKTQKNYANVSICLNFVALIVNQGLAVSILEDLEKLLNINSDPIRKKLIVTLTKCYLSKGDLYELENYALSLSKLLERHDTLSKGVIMSIVSSIQLIVHSYPEQIKVLFVTLWAYFKVCEVNWIILKIIDIFIILSKKVMKELFKSKEVIGYIASLMRKTQSKSVETQLIRLLILNIDSSSYPELYVSCQDQLKTLINFNDINLVLIALRIIRNLYKEHQAVGTEISKSYLTEIFKIMEKGQNERLKDIREHYDKLTSGKINPTTVPVNKWRELINQSFSQKIYNECLEIVYYLVDQNNFKNVCDNILEFVGLLKLDLKSKSNLSLENDFNPTTNESLSETAPLNLEDSYIGKFRFDEDVQKILYTANDKFESISTFVKVVSQDKYQLLNGNFKDFEWLVSRLFSVIFSSNLNQDSERKISFLLKDLCYRVKDLRKEILTLSIKYLKGLISLEKTSLNMSNDFGLTSNEIEYYPRITAENYSKTDSKQTCILAESCFHLLGEFIETLTGKENINLVIADLNLLLTSIIDNELYIYLSPIVVCITKIAIKIADDSTLLPSVENFKNALILFESSLQRLHKSSIYNPEIYFLIEAYITKMKAVLNGLGSYSFGLSQIKYNKQIFENFDISNLGQVEIDESELSVYKKKKEVQASNQELTYNVNNDSSLTINQADILPKQNNEIKIEIDISDY